MSHLARSLLLLLLVSMPVAAQPNRWPYYDPDLIEKLYENDYQHVGNDNASRQDLIAVIAAFGLPNDPDKDCAFVTDDSLAGGAKLAGYIKFLMSDSRTGQYPSGEAGEIAFMSALYPDPPYVYINDPNLVAMAREIETRQCGSDRIQTIRRNFVNLLDDRMAGRNVPASAVASRPRSVPAPQPAISQQDAAAQREAAAAAARQQAAAATAQQQAAAAAATAARVDAERAEAARAALQAQRAQQAQQQVAKAQACMQQFQADQGAERPQPDAQQRYLSCLQELQQLPTH